MANKQDELRKMPSVNRLVQHPDLVMHIEAEGREAVLDAIRAVLEKLRAEISTGLPYPGEAEIVQRIKAQLALTMWPTLRAVINATGVILHTNLGRAPLSEETLQAMRRVGSSYSNLEFDLEAGHRGSRYFHAEGLLCQLSGAEAALLVNNNAGAILLVLSALAKKREVIISRGQLVEIGGGFRIPEVMAQSEAILVEVGTTNRTYITDYAAAITERTAALMRVHSSNFRILGFTHQPTLAEMVGLARERGLWLFDDLGSGCLIDTQPFGLAHEPMVQESIAQGADVVTFSGDKLLGGPQAGIIVGKAELIERLRRHPLTRALRVDKTTIAGVQANLLHYLRGEALTKIPIWRIIAMPSEEVAARARALLEALGPAGARCELIPGRSMIGGGSLPEESLPTTLVALSGGDATALAAALRLGEPPVVAHIQDGRVVLDLRTVLPEEEQTLIGRLRELL